MKSNAVIKSILDCLQIKSFLSPEFAILFLFASIIHNIKVNLYGIIEF